MNTRTISEKLKSRKLWAAVVGVIVGVALIFGVDAGAEMPRHFMCRSVYKIACKQSSPLGQNSPQSIPDAGRIFATKYTSGKVSE